MMYATPNSLLLVALLVAMRPGADVAGLGWLSGCWAPDVGEDGSVEIWSAPAGGSMLGVNRTVRDGRTVFFEYLRIVEQADGSILLTASPSNQPAASFRLIRQSANEVVFENPAHDFPQRIGYRLVSEGRLLGRIEGTVDGAARAVDFPMTALPCHGSQPDT